MQDWRFTLRSFSPLKSLHKFSGKRYARSMSRADVLLKIQATKFNLIKMNEGSNFFSYAVRRVWHYSVLITEQWRIKNNFVYVSSQRLCHWYLFTSLRHMGNQLPLYARLFTLLVPVNVAMVYNATLHLVMEIEDHALVCDELIFRIKKKLLSVL